jgi:hypothetical protein
MDRALDWTYKEAISLAREALIEAGYHQHHRGEWRARRVPTLRDGEGG